MKIITFDGRLGKDAEVLKTKDGKPYVRFSVANNSFSNGQEKTEWFDILSYDPYIAEKRAQYLRKGTYVIITGPIESVPNVYNGKMYINYHVRATIIETPRLGRGGDDSRPAEENEPQVSVYTGGTRSDLSVAPAAVPSPDYSTSDDLPF